MSQMFYALTKIQNGATTKTNPNARDMRGFGRYEGDELKPFEGRPGAMDAFALPSLIDGKRVYPRRSVVEQEIVCECCNGIGTIDERENGYHFNNPEAQCPDCDGKGAVTFPSYQTPKPAQCG